jgi:hypothetical protein
MNWLEKGVIKMKARLVFEIVCGKKTCARVPGEFCRFFRPSLNSAGNCYLFGKLFDEDGWVQRHKECLELAKEED